MDAKLAPDARGDATRPSSPQQLRLALIEGAIRFGEEAESAWETGRYEAAAELIGRCRRIVAELLREVPADQSPLCRQVGGVYLFLFETLVGIQIKRDEAELKRVLNVLREEQETWRQVCRSLAAPLAVDEDRKRAA